MLFRSGFAGDQGKDVFAVPGNILSPFSSGCNQLIREGAEVLTCARDILWRLPAGQFQTWLEQTIRCQENSGSTEQPQAQEGYLHDVIHVLAGHSMTLAEISKHLEKSLHETAVIVTEMEIKGLLQIDRGRYSLTRMALCSI